MYFHQRFIPGLAAYSYLVADEVSGEAAVIDPTRDIGEFVDIARAEGFRIRYVLETHVHADFVSGSRELKALLGDQVTIHSSGMGGDSWTPPYADVVVADGDVVTLGSIRLQAIHTPGHTVEHISWALFDEGRSVDVPWLVFTGDFLFVGSVGRPDLLGEEARKELASQLYSSVFDKLPGLPEFTEVFPGHGAGSLCGKAIGSRSSSTMGFERRFNDSLQQRPQGQWIDELLSGMPLAPPYFARMKKVNASGPVVLGSTLPGQKIFSATEVSEGICEECLVVDARSKEAFAGAHIPGSVNIPLAPTFANWAGWVLPYDTPLLLVVDDASQMEEVTTHLIRVGFDDIQGFLVNGVSDWQNEGYPLSSFETITVEELNRRVSGSVAPFIIDARTEGEWNSGHIDGAHHIHTWLIENRIDEIPRDRPVAVICGSGYRGSIAASLLMRHGFNDVANVLGGMSAWNAASMRVEVPASSS